MPGRQHPPSRAAALLWFGAGTCWVVQFFLPWTSRGALSSSTTLDAVRLVRGGLVDSIVPSWGALLLLTLPALGLSVAGLAGFGGVAATARGVLASGATVVVAAFFHFLAGGDIEVLGPGGWIALAGVLSAALILLAHLAHAVGRPKETPS